MKAIALVGKTGGTLTALIDDEDLDRVRAIGPWRLGGGGVFALDVMKRTVLLHRWVGRVPDRWNIKFRDNNRLNCQKHNLTLPFVVQCMPKDEKPATPTDDPPTSQENIFNQGI